MRAIVLGVIFLFGLISASYAQSTTKYYNKNGSYQGRSVTSGSTTKYYNNRGSYTGRSTTSGNTTKYYNSRGSYTGRSTR